MSHIKTRKYAPQRGGALPLTTLAAGLAMALPAVAAAADNDAKKPEEDAKTLDKVQVRGSWFGSTSSKFTSDLTNTPKTLNIVSAEMIQETGVTNLMDALRMVPGITFTAGEGGNATGDRPFIRGFDGQSNTFIDGLRDVGMQTREVFNLEQIEVVKGPSSAYGGRDSGGGSINLASKTPKLKDETRVGLGAGTDSYYRGTIDANAVLGDGVAARLNVVKHQNDIAGRDAVNKKRFGIAPSVGFGLNGDLQAVVSYYHLETDDLPDSGGFPYSNPSGIPADLVGDGSPYVINRKAFYGLKDRDFQKTKADIGTVDTSWAFGEGAHKLRNVMRSGKTSNDLIWTQPDDSKGNPMVNGTLYRRWNTRWSEAKTFADALSLSGAFATGGLQHSYSVGLEYSDEENHKGSYVISPAATNSGSMQCTPDKVGAASNYDCTDFLNPNPNDPWASLHTVTRSDPALANVQVTKTKSAYAFDTIGLTEKWLVNLGLRFDSIDTVNTTPSLTAPATVLRSKTDALNYQAGIVFKPTENGSLYLQYGTASAPPGMDNGEGNDSISAANQNLDPVETKNVELGVKWALFDNALNLTGAVFHTVMNNARVTVEDGTTQNVGEKKIKGVELGFNGALTPNWNVYGGYTYLDAVLTDNGYACSISSRTGCPSPGVWIPSPNNGNVFPQSAKHQASLWTTYRIGDFTIGGGGNYSSKQYGNAANTQWVPGYTRLDLMAGYAFSPRYDLQLNVQNLTDKLYFDRPHAAHFAGIAPGRSATLTFNARF
ncbi:MAG: TonB-dependent receptor [Pseudoxanthomonas sp.]